MATVIFDFDSTIITCESLELILKDQVKDRPELMEKIHQITDAGIRGKIPFSESLSRRLAIAAPTKEDVEAFGSVAVESITSGMEVYIQRLLKAGVDVWIVSGGIRESLLPVGKKIGIDSTKIFAVQLLWNNENNYAGIDSTDPFSRSKVEGVKGLVLGMASPIIAVGDAMSDYCLLTEELVDHFVLFTEHLVCKEIIELGIEQASNVLELEEKINAIIG